MQCRIFIFLLLCCFCLVSQVEALSTVQWYVDPDASGGGTGVDFTNAYTSLATFEAAEAKDLTVSDEIFVVNCRSSSGGDDTTVFRWSGFGTDATRYVEVTGDSANGGDFPTDGKWDESKYLLHNDDADTRMINVRDEFIRFNKIQFKVTSTSTNERYALQYNLIDVSNELRISNCIFRGVCSGTGKSYAINVSDADANMRIWNTVVYDFFISADIDFVGIFLVCSTAEINHCTIYNCTTGILRSGGTVDVSSCIVGNNGNDFGGTFNSIINCTDDDDDSDSGNQDPLNGDWTQELTDPDNGDRTLADFTLQAGANSVGNGVDDPFSDGFGDPDIAGTSRTTNWDIGAFELVGAPPTGGQFITIQMSAISFIAVLLIFAKKKNGDKTI